MKKYFALTLFAMFCSFFLTAQDESGFPSTEKEFQQLYKQNILKSKINGVYIPKDLADAHQQLIKISDAQGIALFKRANEEVLVKKLRLGLGRWIETNWNFYGGSRLSHYLKKQGLLHPEDMSAFIMVTFYRHLNDLPLNEGPLIEQISKERKKKAREQLLGTDALFEPSKN